MPKIAPGVKVVLLESGETGIVREVDGGVIFLEIDGEIWEADIDDVAPVEEFGYGEEKKKKEQQKLFFPGDEKNISLVFQAVRQLNGEIARFEIYLQNATIRDLHTAYTFFLSGTAENKINKTIDAGTAVLLHEFRTDQLNDNPLFSFSFALVKPDKNFPDHFEKEIRLKAKQFFTKMESEDFRLKNYFIIPVSELPAGKQEEKKTQTISGEDDLFRPEKTKVQKKHEVIAKASMPDSVDLHIEKLVKDSRLLDTSEILSIQLHHFRNFLEKAIVYKLHCIYVIHGLGKGILRAEIEKILNEYPEVKKYNNDYDPRFGFGATAVWLQ